MRIKDWEYRDDISMIEFLRKPVMALRCENFVMNVVSRDQSFLSLERVPLPAGSECYYMVFKN